MMGSGGYYHTYYLFTLTSYLTYYLLPHLLPLTSPITSYLNTSSYLFLQFSSDCGTILTYNYLTKVQHGNYIYSHT